MKSCCVVLSVGAWLAAAGGASAVICIVPDDGSGTAQLPPNCSTGYLSPDQVHMIIDGLPPGTTILVDASHEKFGLTNQGPGGSLGGEFEQFNSCLLMQMSGTGALGGFNRVVFMCGVMCETHIAPRMRGMPVQDFDTRFWMMQGQLPPGDPDFDLLRITAGDAFGMPSPGHTTLTMQPGGDWQVDSFFDITYRIDFIGRPGGPLGGMSGSTTGTIRMATGGPFCGPNATQTACNPVQCPTTSDQCLPRCVNFNPQTGQSRVRVCECTSPNFCHAQVPAAGGPPSCVGVCPPGQICNEIRTPLADGTVDVCCVCEEPPTEACCIGTAAPGGCIDATPADCQAQGGTPQGPGTACSGTTEACCLPNGACLDVDKICCDDLGGTPQGPGSSCANNPCGPQDCAPLPDGSACNQATCPVPPPNERCVPRCVRFNPTTGQSFVFDCDCRNPNECHVALTGAGGGGSGTRGGGNPCVVPDNGGGTVTLPPAGCEYLSPDEVHMIIDGLPAGTTIELGTIHRDFICNRTPGGATVCSYPLGVDCGQPGGSLGGEQECSDSQLAMQLHGTGALAGFDRPALIPISFETHTAPRMPGDPVQSFDTDMFRLFGQITGDPDFDLLRIVGGTDFGLPSPGHTTLTQLPGGNWAVDSFFDITYRIDFVGRPGGPLGGMSGSTTGTIRMATGGAPHCEGGCPAGTVCHEQRIVHPDGTIDLCCDCVPAPQEACCLSTVPGGCAMMTAADCTAAGGVPQGPGTVCTAPEACCLPSGQCLQIDPLCCDDVGGTPQGPGTSCTAGTCPQQCPDLVGARSRKCCDLPINLSPPPITSEPRQGGIDKVVFVYAGPAPAIVPIIEYDCSCPPPPAFGPYPGPSIPTCVQAGVELVCSFTPPLPGPCTYQFRVCSGNTVVPVRLRSLLGDVNDDGQTNGTDRSIVVGVWTGAGYSCKTDLNCDGTTNATDRSIVVGAWTSGANCAP